MSDPRRIEFGVYLPQLQADFATLRDRVLRAEALGYDTAWFYDHLYPPGLPDVPGFEGWTLVSALAALTGRIRLGQLVLCNGFRHPALLAQMAITLDVISGGRLELGLGSGSNLTEFAELSRQLPVGIAISRDERRRILHLTAEAEVLLAAEEYDLPRAAWLVKRLVRSADRLELLLSPEADATLDESIDRLDAEVDRGD